MDFKIVHRLPNRVRVRYNRGLLDARQASLVQMLIAFQDGITNVEVNTVSGSVLIEYDGKQLGEFEALAFLKAIDDKYLKNEELLRQVTVPAAQESLASLIISMVVEFYVKRFLLPLPVRKILSLLNLAPRILKGAKSICTGKIFSADTLDATALTLSYATGDLNTAGSIALLLNMGDTLEDYTKRKSYDSLASSLLTTDEMVQVVQDNGEEVAVSVSLLKAGDIVISRAGSVIPVDGTVVSGEAMVNQASMTGESLPVHKEKDFSVLASTIVEEGEIRIQVKQAGGETKVNKIVALIDQSQELKAASQVRAERIADRLVRYNFLLAGLTYLVTRNFTKAASTLLVDYSCAMKLSAPICVLSAMRDSAKKGIMAKGGKYLEELAKADVVVFDKTGTLTESTPKVTNVIPFGKHKEEEVLKLAACLEEHFPHSLARAVVKEAADRGIDHMEEHAKVEYVLAHGIASSLDGKKLRIGSAHFIFDDEKIKKTKEAQKVIDEYAETGSSLLYFSIGNSLAGIIVIQDPIREESVRAVAELKRLGVKKIVMITGDGENTARIIAKKSGVDEYISQALPDTKVEFIKKMQAEGHKVVMIGDGINDAPALSAADVGIAMGAASQIAAQTADIILPDDGLSSLPELRQIGLNLMKRISGNNAAIVAINTTLIALGLAGVVSSSTAALFHNSSTVAISMNAMRPLIGSEQADKKN